VNPGLHQWFTPAWVCEAIIERCYADLDLGDRVVEPFCGDGRMLMALPNEISAIGIEIDPLMAERARQNTGRTIICGDFFGVEISGPVTHFVGNPPFDAKLIHRFLSRAHAMLEPGGSCGLLLPAYVLQHLPAAEAAAGVRDVSQGPRAQPVRFLPLSGGC
jgi:hypothetical protein